MVTRISLSGVALIVIGLLIVIVHALNMGNLHSVDTQLPELGIVLVGIAVQFLGLGIVTVSKK